MPSYEARSRPKLPNPEKEEKGSLWLHFFKTHGIIGAGFIIAFTFFIQGVASHISKKAAKAAENTAIKILKQAAPSKECQKLKIDFFIKHPRTIGNRPPSPYGQVKILNSNGNVYKKENIGHRKGKNAFTAKFFERTGISIKSGSKIKIWLGHKFCKRIFRKTYCPKKRAYVYAEALLNPNTKTSAQNHYYNASIECINKRVQP